MVGCSTPGKPVATTNLEATVEALFTVDGCTVYRFWDHFAPRYFVNCHGGTLSSVPQGKGRRTEEIPTWADGAL